MKKKYGYGIGRDMKAVGVRAFIRHYGTWVGLKEGLISKEDAKTILANFDPSLVGQSLRTKVDSGLRILNKYSDEEIRRYISNRNDVPEVLRKVFEYRRQEGVL